MMTDTFWALVGLLLFLAVLGYYKIPTHLRNYLDKRADHIRDELDEARRLRDEAQELLAEYQRKRQEAEKEAEEIIASAKHEAEMLAKEAHKKMEEYVTRRNKMAEHKIAQAEADAIAAVKSSAVDLAVAAARDIIEKEMDKRTADNLIKTSLTEVKNHLN